MKRAIVSGLVLLAAGCSDPGPTPATPTSTVPPSAHTVAPGGLPLPKTEEALILRTDFSDEDAWQQLCTAIEAPVGQFRAYVDFVSDKNFEGLTTEQILKLAQAGTGRSFLFVVDKRSITDPQHPILVLDLLVEPGRQFRVIPKAMWEVENNLSIANADFADFANDADASGGVYLGVVSP